VVHNGSSSLLISPPDPLLLNPFFPPVFPGGYHVRPMENPQIWATLPVSSVHLISRGLLFRNFYCRAPFPCPPLDQLKPQNRQKLMCQFRVNLLPRLLFLDLEQKGSSTDGLRIPSSQSPLFLLFSSYKWSLQCVVLSSSPCSRVHPTPLPYLFLASPTLSLFSLLSFLPSREMKLF